MEIVNSIRFPGYGGGASASTFSVDLAVTAPQLTSDATAATYTATGVYNGKTYSASGANGSATIAIKEPGTYDVSGVVHTTGVSDIKRVPCADSGQPASVSVNFCIVNITAQSDSTVTLTLGDKTFTQETVNKITTFYLPSTGTWVLHATDGTQTKDQNIECPSYQTYDIQLTYEDYSVTHNATYRGQDLLAAEHFGSIDNLYSAVKMGDMSDVWVGDYVTYNNMKYIVMGVDFYKGKGVVENELHHLVMVPEHILGKAQMNTSQTNTTGYANSVMHKTTLPSDTYFGVMNTAFGGHILNGTWTLTTNNNNATAKQTCKIRLLNEMAVFGSRKYGNSYDDGEMNAQLPGFKLKSALKTKKYNNSAAYWWLSSVYGGNSYSFCFVYSGETAYYDDADYSWGVVPVVLFG